MACHAGAKPEERVAAIRRRYGADRTFAADPDERRAGRPGAVSAIPGRRLSWRRFRVVHPALRLHVVSYAPLPALIAIGVLLARRNPAPNPLARALRRALEPMALRKLETLQPRHGGFLEATPLTAFVAMSLLSLPGEASPVARRCLEFLRASVRADGSWPIDTNLSVWLTTSATTALCAGGSPTGFDAGRTRRWIQGQQLRVVHPYTGAAPGGWSWTHLPGGVPDGDDTSGRCCAGGGRGR